MAELGEDDADYRCFTRIEEEGAEFCFGGGGKHVLDYCRENVYCSVEGWWSCFRVGREMRFFWKGAEEEISSRTRLGTVFR